MTLAEKINEDIKAAMLAKDSKKLEALRAIKSGLLILKTGKGAGWRDPPGPGDGFVEKSLSSKEKNQRLSTVKRAVPSLPRRKNSRASIIEKYLPEQISGDALKEEVQKIIAEVGAESMKDMGRVMGMASKKFAGQADNKEISMIVKEMLS